MKKHFFILALITLFASFAQAQMMRQTHQSFETADVNNITIEMDDQCKVETWPGNTILVEVHVKMWNGTPQTLDYMIKNERYALVADQSGAAMFVKAKNGTRKTIKTKSGEITEEVTVKILIPEDFTPTDAEKRNFVKTNARYGESN